MSDEQILAEITPDNCNATGVLFARGGRLWCRNAATKEEWPIGLSAANRDKAFAYEALTAVMDRLRLSDPAYQRRQEELAKIVEKIMKKTEP